MSHGPGFFLTVLAFALVIGPLVFVHELGHYLAGRLFGVQVDAFSIGFGHEVAGFTDRHGTRWKFGWLPLGGYVRFAGDMGVASEPDPAWARLPAQERGRTFPAKPLWQRAIIVAAGPAINFVVAILILAGFALAYGDSRTPTVVGSVVERSAAARAGLHPGDRIAAIGGVAVERFDQLVNYVVIRPGETTDVQVERGGARIDLPITIGVHEDRDRFGNIYRIGQIGVGSVSPVVVPVRVIDAPGIGLRRTAQIVSGTLTTLGQIVTGRRSVSELGGPLRIAQVSGQQFSLGWPELIWLVAMISINLGFINLLPVPMLDGGHLLFYGIEAVRRRPVSADAQEWAFRGGLAAILALMLLVTFNDLGALGLWKNLAGLIG